MAARLKVFVTSDGAKPAGPSKAQLRRIAELERRLDESETTQAKALAEADAAVARAQAQREKLVTDQARERASLAAKLKAARDAPG